MYHCSACWCSLLALCVSPFIVKPSTEPGCELSNSEDTLKKKQCLVVTGHNNSTIKTQCIYTIYLKCFFKLPFL